MLDDARLRIRCRRLRSKPTNAHYWNCNQKSVREQSKTTITEGMVAHRAGRPIDRLKSWALAVQARTNHNKAACALANKLARIAWAVWVKQENYRPTRVTSRSTEA